jgi:hypothetical protein
VDGLTDLAARRAVMRAPAQMREGMVATPALTAAGLMRIVLDTQPGRVREAPWPPRPGETPMPDDAVLACESDAGQTWVVAWWPQ